MGVLFDVGPSETRSAAPDGRHRSITGLSLVNPAAAAGQRAVSVWAEDDGHEEQYVIGTLSPEQPIVAVRPQVVVGDELLLRHDAVAATVRFYGRVLSEEEVAALDVEEDPEEEMAVLDNDGEEEEGAVLEDEEDEEAGEASSRSRVEFYLTDDDEKEEARPAKQRKFADEE